MQPNQKISQAKKLEARKTEICDELRTNVFLWICKYCPPEKVPCALPSALRQINYQIIGNPSSFFGSYSFVDLTYSAQQKSKRWSLWKVSQSFLIRPIKRYRGDFRLGQLFEIGFIFSFFLLSFYIILSIFIKRIFYHTKRLAHIVKSHHQYLRDLGWWKYRFNT